MLLEHVQLDQPLPVAQRARVMRWKQEREGSNRPVANENWREWLQTRFPTYVTAGFAPRHVHLWEWLTALQPGTAPAARIDIWPRGGAKSSSAELGCAWVCERRTRTFVLYVCSTQDQADVHIGTIATLLETLGVRRALNVYGHSKGWRRQQLRTDTGFNVAGLGLDVAARGIKLDQYRPDLVIFDDVDAREDSEVIVNKKKRSITQTVLPAGAPDCAVLFIQNLVHKDSVAAQLVDGRANFLLHRAPPIVESAATDLKYEPETQADGTIRYRVTDGVATWEGQDLGTIEKQLNDWGPTAFNREAQHGVHEVAGALWTREMIERTRVRPDQMPRLVRKVVGVDPPGGATECGLINAGLGENGHLYVYADHSRKGSPGVWGRLAVQTYLDDEADRILGEKNFGGDMVEHTIRTVRDDDDRPIGQHVSYKNVTASRGKLVRAEPVQALWESGQGHIVGSLPFLEDEMCSYVPGMPSPNRLDAMVWCAIELFPALSVQVATVRRLAI